MNKFQKLKGLLAAWSKTKTVVEDIDEVDPEINFPKSLNKLLITKFSQAWNYFLTSNCCLCRGDDDWSDEKIITVKPTERHSAGTSNIYTMLISKWLPSWKGYPQRNHAVICATNEEICKEYSDSLFAIFPKNNTPFVISPHRDVWYAFPKLFKAIYIRRMDYVEETLAAIANRLNFMGVKLPYRVMGDNVANNFKKFGEELKKADIDKIMVGCMDETVIELAKYLSRMLEKRNIIEIFDDLMNPMDNGFKLVNDITKVPFHGTGVEVWFDDECLVMPLEFAYEFRYTIVNYSENLEDNSELR